MVKIGEIIWERKGDSIDLTVETEDVRVTLHEITQDELEGLIDELEMAKQAIQ
jgi:hypothetical protein